MTPYLCESEDLREPTSLANLARNAVGLERLSGRGVDDLVAVAAFTSFVPSLETCWMAYQPILRWSDGELVGFEALLRSHASADRFPCDLACQARRLGAMGLLSRTIRTRIAADIPALPARVPVFVNLEPQDLLDEGLRRNEDPLAPFAERVVFELTEREGRADSSTVSARMEDLRRSGYRFALDDLGAGRNGLASLADLQVDAVKLDMSLIRGIQRNRTKQRLVRFIDELCQERGVICICEGVEQDAELEALLGLGCDVFQGFLLGRPTRAWVGGGIHAI